jgi:hypothetical protein
MFLIGILLGASVCGATGFPAGVLVTPSAVTVTR